MSWIVAGLIGAAITLVGVSLLIKSTASTITIKPDPSIAAQADKQKADAVAEAHKQEQQIAEATNADVLDRLNRL